MSTALINNPPGKICLVPPLLIASSRPVPTIKKENLRDNRRIRRQYLRIARKARCGQKFRNCSDVKNFPG